MKKKIFDTMFYISALTLKTAIKKGLNTYGTALTII